MDVYTHRLFPLKIWVYRKGADLNELAEKLRSICLLHVDCVGHLNCTSAEFKTEEVLSLKVIDFLNGSSFMIHTCSFESVKTPRCLQRLRGIMCSGESSLTFFLICTISLKILVALGCLSRWKACSIRPAPLEAAEYYQAVWNFGVRLLSYLCIVVCQFYSPSSNESHTRIWVMISCNSATHL